MAVRLAVARSVECADGAVIPGKVNDFLITRGKVVVDCCSREALESSYDIVVEGTLTIPSELRRRLEGTTGIGTARSAAELVEAVERLASISIGTIKVDFTPGQLTELKFRASKRNHTIKQELQAVVDRIKDEIFWKG